MALEKELETYKRELPGLLEKEGKFVLVHGEELVGVFDTYEDALKIGYEKFGLQSFLVKKVQADERMLYFTRDISPSMPHLTLQTFLHFSPYMKTQPLQRTQNHGTKK
jgi:hypothetical protein